MNFINEYVSDSPEEDATNDQTIAFTNSPPKKTRARFRVIEKKQYVENYYEYINVRQIKESIVEGDKFMSEFTRSLQGKLETRENTLHTIDNKLLSKWVEAYKQGQLATTNEDAKSNDNWRVMRRIENGLLSLFPNHAEHNEIDFSKIYKKKYGVVARKFTPKGTFLGFCKGLTRTVDKSSTATPNEVDDCLYIGQNLCIDMSEERSCFAKYYNCAPNHEAQNVCVYTRDDWWPNTQKAICFITNRDVQRGEEFFVLYGPTYWVCDAKYLPRDCRFKKSVELHKEKNTKKLCTPLCSSEDLRRLADQFVDDDAQQN